MKKHNNSRKKSELTSKRAKTRGPMRRDTKEVLAELVVKLKEKLDSKKVAATSGEEEDERGELRPNRHLSIKLCLSDSCGGLETRLEHGIELVKYGSDILGQAFPFALLERRDGDAELEL